MFYLPRLGTSPATKASFSTHVPFMLLDAFAASRVISSAHSTSVFRSVHF